MKDLIDIQNNDNKCFLWCHVRHLNFKYKNLWRITKKDKEIAENLSYSNVDFPVSKNDYSKIEVMNKININVFSYEDKIIYPAYFSDQSFNDVLDLLLVCNHYVYIKDFNRLIFNKTKPKGKKWFCKCCLCCFSSEKVLFEHKKDCLMINGGQRVKLEKGFIEFNNFNKMIPAPFKIYADFECLLKDVDSRVHNDCLVILQDIKIIILVILFINLFVLMINLVKILHCTEERMLFINLFRVFLMNILIVRV